MLFASSVHCYIYQPSWQSCTGDAAPRVVNMHGIRGGVHVRGGSPTVVLNMILLSTPTKPLPYIPENLATPT